MTSTLGYKHFESNRYHNVQSAVNTCSKYKCVIFILKKQSQIIDRFLKTTDFSLKSPTVL